MRTTVVVIGAGHSGLAVSRRLTERSIDHVVIERGEVANSWRTERWDSLRLLTPNWLTNLPGLPYGGDQPDGYMTAADLATHIGGYAATIDAPVHTRTNVIRVRAGSCGYDVVTDRGRWQCRGVGDRQRTLQLGAAAGSGGVRTADDRRSHRDDYRSPAGLAEGGVLVVGASATGVQLAEEIHHSGRPVTLAVGEHVRMPRTYRGRDIFWWTDATATLDERYDELDDLVRARRLPSPQLVGSADRRSIDINYLARQGITIVGRLGRITNGVAQFSGLPDEHVRTRRPQDEPPARPARYVGAAHRRRRRHARTVPAHARCSRPPLEVDLGEPASRPCCSQPDSSRTTRGSTFPCSTGAAASSTTAA